MIFKEFPDINFIEETQDQFDIRIKEVHKLWGQMDKEMPKEIIFDLLFTANARKRMANEALEEIPKLIDFVNREFPTPDQEFEDRLEKFKNG